MNRYVIVTGGQIDDSFALKWINVINPDYIIASDYGMEFLRRVRITPDIIIGDFDSVGNETLDFFRQCKGIQWRGLNPVKDDTDTEAAVRLAIECGAGEITLLGATGSRLDHVLANIELLGIGLKENVPMTIVDAYNRIRMIDSDFTIRKDEQFGSYVSLIPYSMKVENVCLKGFKYELDDYCMEMYNSLGVSNEIVADEAVIRFSSGVLVVVESVD